MDKKDIKSMSIEELKSDLKQLGQPSFRAGQIFEWLQQKHVDSFDEMTNLSKQLRDILNKNYYIAVTTIEKKLISEYDGTVKYLFKLHDGEFIETVLMKYNHGYSICISSQVGCKMGCTFCATGMGGFCRNLTPSELLAQITTAQKDNNIRISNVVLMGMGEPLDNFENVIKFLKLVSDEKGINIGMRHISLSTCGVVDKIYELMEYNFQLTLSISLHAPNDIVRSKTMPINRKWNIQSLITACKEYTKKTKRRISFEYSLISGVNDTDECASELSTRLKGMMCHVNLIPVNQVVESGYLKPNQKRILAFKKILEDNGITTTVRRTLGSDIDASCGQLRRNTIANK